MEMGLRLNPKTTILNAKNGIDFCGYRIWATHMKPRKSTIKRAKRRFKRMVELYKNNPEILVHAKNSIQSFLGYIKHCSGYYTTMSTLKKTVFIGGAS
jgi:hypothetical protein